MYFSMCSWGVANSWEWGPPVGNSWRTDDDISDNWDSMLRCLDNCVGLAKYAGPGVSRLDPLTSHTLCGS
jgi:alpha-galactosidase